MDGRANMPALLVVLCNSERTYQAIVVPFILATPCTNLALDTVAKYFGNKSILFAMTVIRGNLGQRSNEPLKLAVPQYI